MMIIAHPFAYEVEYHNKRKAGQMVSFQEMFKYMEETVIYKYIEYCKVENIRVMEFANAYVATYKKVHMAILMVINGRYVMSTEHTTLRELYYNVMNIVYRMDRYWLNKSDEYNKQRNAFMGIIKKIYNIQ